MSEPLVHVIRTPIVESIHRGSIVAVNGSGKLLAYAGDPEFKTYMRSSAKPIQALNVILSGAADRFALTDRELAIICSSHYGEPMHRETVYGILEKIGCRESDLLCGAVLSIQEAERNRQLSEHVPIDNTCSDCSGKHSGFLAVCRTKGYPTENYNSPDHPMQREILGILSELCRYPKEEFAIGVDGCSVPVHALPLRNMAVGYARLTTPDELSPEYADACRRVFRAMNAHPLMVAGTNGFCSELISATGGRLIGKLGAEALYCIGFRDLDLGIAVRIEDGSMRALQCAVMETLDQLSLLSAKEMEALRRFIRPANRNDKGDVIGSLEPVFRLHFC